MDNRFLRTEMLIGTEALEKLKNSKVAIFGVGGVGGYVCESLARAGIGSFILVDNDTVSISNINRQIIALESSVGKYKTEVMAERIKNINPNANVKIYNKFFLGEEDEYIIDTDCDYIVDAIDTVTAKIALVLLGEKLGIPVISSMGTGNKLDPTRFEISDIYKTSICPLAKVMRKELKARGVKKLKVLYSKEQPREASMTESEILEKGEKTNKRRTPASISFVPPVAGLIIGGEVIKDLTGVR